MDDALALHHDLNFFRRQTEEPYGLDELQTLVHQGSRVDGDLCAHVPVGVLEGVCTGLAAQLLGGHAEEGAAGGREQNFGQAGSALLILQALEDGGVLAVHRQQLYPVLFHSLRDQMTAGDKAFLVGQRQVMAALDGAQAGTKTGNAHHAVQHHIRAVQRSQFLQPLRAGEQLGCICPAGQRGVQLCGGIRVGHADIFRVELLDLLQDLFHMAVGRKAVDLVPLGADDIQTLGTDGAGRTQQRYFFRHDSFLLCIRRRTRR